LIWALDSAGDVSMPARAARSTTQREHQRCARLDAIDDDHAALVLDDDAHSINTVSLPPTLNRTLASWQ